MAWMLVNNWDSRRLTPAVQAHVNVPLKLLLLQAFFSPKCIKYRLAAGLRPDLLGKLTVLRRTPSWI